VDKPLGVNPAQRMIADTELAGAIRHDDGMGQKAMVADRSPQRAFCGDPEGGGFAPLSRDMEAANTRLAAFSLRVRIAAAADQDARQIERTNDAISRFGLI
jgi:hypothetical protein